MDDDDAILLIFWMILLNLQSFGFQVRQLLSEDPRNSEYADMEKELKEVIDTSL